MKDYSKHLLDRLRKILRKYCKVACDEVRQQWGALDTIDGDATITERELEITQDTVARALCAYGQKAWIAEFGKGSLMDDSSTNPFLDDYINSPIFNKARLSGSVKIFGSDVEVSGRKMAVVGRPRGVYYDIDGNPHTSHGNLEEIPIERWKGQPLFTPIRGKHIISNILEKSGLIDEMNEEIQTAVMDIMYELMGRFPKEIKIC